MSYFRPYNYRIGDCNEQFLRDKVYEIYTRDKDRVEIDNGSDFREQTIKDLTDTLLLFHKSPLNPDFEMKHDIGTNPINFPPHPCKC